MSKRLAISIGLLLFVSIMFTGLAAAAPAPKVDVCHIDESGVYHKINISENALQAHVDHGDSSPGDPYPDMLGYIFGADCAPEFVFANVAGTWDGYSGIVGNLHYGFHMYLAQDANGDVTGTIQYYIDSTALRNVTGSVAGNNFTFRTHANEDPNLPYWADCEPCVVTVNGTHFEGTGDHSGSGTVGWIADKQ